jgi:hypothetical protein
MEIRHDHTDFNYFSRSVDVDHRFSGISRNHSQTGETSLSVPSPTRDNAPRKQSGGILLFPKRGQYGNRHPIPGTI